MQVKLVSYSQPTQEFRDMGLSDLSDLISFCARVSNPSNQLNMETSDKLIAYLAKYKHWSPFEMVSATVGVTTTRDIARQMLRHRSFSFQEFSQRYADPTKDMEFVLREARLQDTKNRQNSIDMDDSDASDDIKREWAARQHAVIALARESYTWATSVGIAKEQARCVLPEGNTVSSLYVSGNIRSFIHFVDVRTDIATQKEHRQVALAIADAIAHIFTPILNYTH